MFQKVFSIVFFLSVAFIAKSQDTLTNKKGSKYQFTPLNNTISTSVKDQCKTATCWSYSSLSFLESELIRKGKGNYNLSEMYIVRCAYIEKAITYIRMGGKHQFEQGGEFHDIPYIISKYGMVPEEVYSGLQYGEERHNHEEMTAMLKGMLENLKNNPQGTYTPVWTKAVAGVVDAYLGTVPETFTYKGKEYTPQSFAASLDLQLENYVMLTSFTHHPYYKPFVIEVPDNWSMQTAENVPMDEFIQTMNNAVANGYGIAWAADVSEKGFSFRDGLGIVPIHDTLVKSKGVDSEYFNDAGAQRSGSAFDQPYPEKQITAEMRQDAFDKQSTTDDHGMHITGKVKDQRGAEYFIVKNSWGTSNYLNGYLYISDSYAKYKTISIMVHKDGLTKELKKKLNIQ